MSCAADSREAGEEHCHGEAQDEAGVFTLLLEQEGPSSTTGFVSAAVPRQDRSSHTPRAWLQELFWRKHFWSKLSRVSEHELSSFAA